jgi:hypothetical protein
MFRASFMMETQKPELFPIRGSCTQENLTTAHS